MQNYLIIFIIFPLVSFSLDESYFENQNNQCICAVKPFVCNPYCDCDPFCTDEQKKEFDIKLPESYSGKKISCDPKEHIKNTNLNSIHKEIVNGINCYSIKGNEDGKKIQNYSPKDFGIDNYNQAIDEPFAKNKFSSHTGMYYEGEKVIANNANDAIGLKNVYFPIAVGSSTSNAFIPFLAGVSYPNYSCRFHSQNPFSDISSFSIFNTIFDPLGKETWLTFPAFRNFFSTAYRTNYILNLQYILTVDDLNTSNPNNFSIKQIPPPIENLDFPNEFMIFSFEVFFGSKANYQDNIYQPLNMGYYFGTPIMVDTQPSNGLFGENRVPLRIGDKVDILFGVNSTIIFPVNKSKKVSDQLFPQYKFYKSFGPIITNQVYEDYLIDFDRDNINVTISANLKTPIARWTFYYKKFNNESVPVYFLQGFTPHLIQDDKYTPDADKIMYKIEFIEVDEFGKLLVPEEIRFHSQSYSTIFDVFFRDPSESLNTIGVLFCFALMGTIWCWYVCFFYIED